MISFALPSALTDWHRERESLLTCYSPEPRDNHHHHASPSSPRARKRIGAEWEARSPGGSADQASASSPELCAEPPLPVAVG